LTQHFIIEKNKEDTTGRSALDEDDQRRLFILTVHFLVNFSSRLGIFVAQLMNGISNFRFHAIVYMGNEIYARKNLAITRA
jgi:hypothetical protein